MKVGLNSEAAALSALLDMVCGLMTGDTPAPGCCHEGKIKGFIVPKTNGLAKGFKETGLRPAGRGGAISTGRDG